MAIAALVAWVLTALGGFYMLAQWVAGGGPRRQSPTKIPPSLIFGHFFFAVVGLVLWIIYVVLDEMSVAWIAFIALIAVVLIGFMMLAGWIPVYRRTAGTPEHGFPVVVGGAHGVLAVATVVLTLLAALGVGAS
ncbi:MAG TPA: hypothetical protein VH496_05225 [Mycobacterium sp.]|jgi:hypothetical protein